MRVIFDGAFVVEAPATITGISKANPATITATNSLGDGDWVYISGIEGMVELNGLTFIVSGESGSAFNLLTLDSDVVDSTTFSAYVSGGTASRVFELTTPYAGSDLPLLKFVQSADVMYLTHTSYPAMALSRLAADNWTIAAVSLGPSISPPTGVTVVATVNPTTGTSPPVLPTSYGYVITAVATTTNQESQGSAMGIVTNSVDISATNGANIVSWTGVSGAAFYNVYVTLANYNTDYASTTNAYPPPVGSQLGFIGQTTSTTFVDSNVTPDFSTSPPNYSDPFAPGQVLYIAMTANGSGYNIGDPVTITSGTGSGFLGEIVLPVAGTGGVQAVVVINGGKDYLSSDTVVFGGSGTGATATLGLGPLTGTSPGVCAFFQERLVFANTNSNPDTLYFSQPGNYTNFNIHSPVEDGDAITTSPFGQEVNGIQFLVSMPGGLVVLTGLQAWQILGPGSFGAISVQPITPGSISAVPQAYNGISSQVPPYVVLYDIIYVQNRGSIVRDLNYNFFANIYTGTDLTILSSHLFEGYQIVSAVWVEEPFKLYWAVRSDGTLLSMTYLKEQQVNSWARHDTPGLVKCITSITEQPVDALYAVVERSYAPTGGAIFTIERLDNRLWQTTEDPFCVDAGVAIPAPPLPSVDLTISSLTGTTNLFASGSFFNSGYIGWVVRAGGGIAVVTAIIDDQNATATWSFPYQLAVPGTTLTQRSLAGNWSISPQSTIVAGLGHLVGQTVSALADGVPVTGLVVTPIYDGIDGAVTLPFAASCVRVGLPYSVQIQTVKIEDPQSGGTLQGRRKSITAVTARVANTSGGFTVGTNQQDGSTQAPAVIAVPWSPMYACFGTASNDAAPLSYISPGGQLVVVNQTDDLRVNLKAAWRKAGQIAVQQTLPQPLSLLGLVVEYSPGDSPEIVAQEKQSPGGGRPPPQRRAAAKPEDGGLSDFLESRYR